MTAESLLIPKYQMEAMTAVDTPLLKEMEDAGVVIRLPSPEDAAKVKNIIMPLAEADVKRLDGEGYRASESWAVLLDIIEKWSK